MKRCLWCSDTELGGLNFWPVYPCFYILQVPSFYEILNMARYMFCKSCTHLYWTLKSVDHAHNYLRQGVEIASRFACTCQAKWNTGPGQQSRNRNCLAWAAMTTCVLRQCQEVWPGSWPRITQRGLQKSLGSWVFRFWVMFTISFFAHSMQILKGATC